VARYTRQIRRSIRGPEIVHNVIWYARKPRDRWSRMQLRASNVIGVERGVNDAGLTGDDGRFALTTFLAYVDWIHRQRRGVLFDEEVMNATSREYGLAGYLLVNAGGDFLRACPTRAPTTGGAAMASRSELPLAAATTGRASSGGTSSAAWFW
jgi:hypothetical protein